ncbi:MAG TPA: efflux RND transporter periplasmic adaptor subunit [Deltaproteobacteria bacterium]|nr:efflux RND transporter periplasmic adaptor subunit [Deltaproteobacteria bacterium]
MPDRKRKIFFIALLAAVIAASGAFLYLRPSVMRLEEVFHFLAHETGLQRVMGWTGLGEETGIGGKKLYWCPMHPQVRRERPGPCPICNMQLVEMDEEKETRADVLRFTDRQLQQAGVRTAAVRLLDLFHEIDTTGRVAVDERLLRTVSNRVRGRSRIERLHVDFTGQTVARGQPLVSLYSPDLVTTQQEYLAVLARGGPWAGALLEAARARLERWGVSSEQIEAVAESGRPVEVVTIRSPLSGTVIRRLVTEGQYVEEGEPLLEIADLSRVWIYGDVYERELPFIRTGMAVEVTAEGIGGRRIEGAIDFIDPLVRPESRTVGVRFAVGNADGLLRPGMSARVRIRTRREKVPAVPASAVLLTGRRAVVIVAEGGGLMRPVEVRLGRKWLYGGTGQGERKNSFLADDERYHEVLSGVSVGQRVVTAGNFLVAAEAGFQGVLKKMLPPEGEADAGEVGAAPAQVFESYEEIRKALAADETASVKETALRMVEEIDALNTGDGGLQRALQEVRSAASALAGEGDETGGLRLRFSALSKTLIALVERYGLPAGLERHAFFCPMARGYGGWLQPGRAVENPYMGRKMSSCGAPLPLKDAGAEP